jgi:hypothetical protein
LSKVKNSLVLEMVQLEMVQLEMVQQEKVQSEPLEQTALNASGQAASLVNHSALMRQTTEMTPTGDDSFFRQLSWIGESIRGVLTALAPAPNTETMDDPDGSGQEGQTPRTSGLGPAHLAQLFPSELLRTTQPAEALQDYRQALAGNTLAQAGLLAALFVWLGARRMHRLRRERQHYGLYRPSATVFGFLSLVSFGGYAVVWLWRNYGRKRHRASIRYWVGDELCRFPSIGFTTAVILLTVLVCASLQSGSAGPLLLLGSAFWALCPKVRALRGAVGKESGSPLGGALGGIEEDLALLSASSDPDYVGRAVPKKPHADSIVA